MTAGTLSQASPGVTYRSAQNSRLRTIEEDLKLTLRGSRSLQTEIVSTFDCIIDFTVDPTNKIGVTLKSLGVINDYPYQCADDYVMEVLMTTITVGSKEYTSCVPYDGSGSSANLHIPICAIDENGYIRIPEVIAGITTDFEGPVNITINGVENPTPCIFTYTTYPDGITIISDGINQLTLSYTTCDGSIYGHWGLDLCTVGSKGISFQVCTSSSPDSEAVPSDFPTISNEFKAYPFSYTLIDNSVYESDSPTSTNSNTATPSVSPTISSSLTWTPSVSSTVTITPSNNSNFNYSLSSTPTPSVSPSATITPTSTIVTIVLNSSSPHPTYTPSSSMSAISSRSAYPTITNRSGYPPTQTSSTTGTQSSDSSATAHTTYTSSSKYTTSPYPTITNRSGFPPTNTQSATFSQSVVSSLSSVQSLTPSTSSTGTVTILTTASATYSDTSLYTTTSESTHTAMPTYTTMSTSFHTATSIPTVSPRVDPTVLPNCVCTINITMISDSAYYFDGVQSEPIRCYTGAYLSIQPGDCFPVRFAEPLAPPWVAFSCLDIAIFASEYTKTYSEGICFNPSDHIVPVVESVTPSPTPTFRSSQLPVPSLVPNPTTNPSKPVYPRTRRIKWC